MSIESKGNFGGKTSSLRNPGQWEGGRCGCTPIKLALILAVGWWVLATGCGVKGPPVPLWQASPLPAVADLAGRVADGRVTLTWQLQSSLDSQAARQASFIIRRSRTAFDEPSCENCPQVFETVGNVPYVETDDGSYTLTLGLDAGFRYVFMVHLQTEHGIGPAGEPVQFDYPMDKHDQPEVVP